MPPVAVALGCRAAALWRIFSVQHRGRANVCANGPAGWPQNDGAVYENLSDWWHLGLPPDAFEGQLRQMLPAWLAMDLRLMFQGYHERGFAPNSADAAALTTLIGHAPRRYEDFAHE